MVTHTRNWCSAFNPSKCTHTHTQQWVVNTHCEHAPGAVGSHCSSARGAIGGSVPCSRAPQSWYWRWSSFCSFTIPTFNPCRTWDSNPLPLDYKSDSLTIRPRLPLKDRSVRSGIRDGRYLIVCDIPVKILPAIIISLPAIITITSSCWHISVCDCVADVKLRRSLSLNK